MTSSSISHIQAAAITEDYPALSDDSCGTAETYCRSTFVEAIFYPYPASDHPISSLQAAAYDGNQLPYYCGADWLSNYDSAFGSCWVENLFSYNYSTNSNDYGVHTEDPHQNEEHYDTNFGYQEDNDNQPAFDYNAGYESWPEEIFNYSVQEPRLPYASSLEELGFFEGIFGYWPYLFREMQYN